MRLEHFFRWFLLAAALQIFFVLGGYVLLVGPNTAKTLRNDVLLVVYGPFIHFVSAVGGYSGESGMIWPPVFGVLLGVATYSIILAIIVSSFRARRFRN